MTGFFPYLSFHPPFFRLATPVFSTVRRLYMSRITFNNFSDFAKLLNCFPRLEMLLFQEVQWLTLGVVPGCMTRRAGGTFLQNLNQLIVRTPPCPYPPRASSYVSYISFMLSTPVV